MDRRAFLGSLAALGVTAAGGAYFLPRLVRNGNKGRYVLSPSVELVGERTAFDILDLETLETFTVWLPLQQPHGTALHPEGDLVYVFDSSGKRACSVSLREKRCVKEILAHPERLFEGHGFYHPVHKLVYCAETDKAGQGYLVARDPHSLQPRFELASGGKNPHEIYFLPGRNLALIANEGDNGDGSTSNLTAIDLEAKAVRAQVATPWPKARIRHLALLGEDLVGIAAKNRLQPSATDSRIIQKFQAQGDHRQLYLYKNGHTKFTACPMLFYDLRSGKLTEKTAAPEIFSSWTNSNSIASDPQGHLCVSHTEGHAVSVWQGENQELLAHFSLKERPRGVIYSARLNCFLLHTAAGSLFRLHSPDFRPLKLENARLQGYAHLTISV